MAKVDLIDYQNFATALSLYERLGYERIDTPWLVSESAIMTTKPPQNRSFETFGGHLVASGEQGFIQMMQDGQLEQNKRYMTLTPCFRDDAVDEWHRTSFMKLELIWAYPLDPERTLNIVLNDARFVIRHLGVNTTVHEMSDGSFDLESRDKIEMGSYGFRSTESFSWIFGTGLAEPRFSQVRAKELAGLATRML